MKTLLNKIFILCIFTLVFCSCEKDEDKVIVKPEASPVLSSTASTVVLSKADAVKDAVTLSWTPADYGFNAGVKYALQFDKKGRGFAKAKTVMFDSIHKITYKVGELNWIALSLGLPKGVANDLEVRVASGVSSKIDSLKSNITTISVTPYLDGPVLSGSVSTITLAKADASKDGITFTATPADFGSKDAQPNYYLEFAKKGTNFSKPYTIDFPSSLSLKMKIDDVDKCALKAGLPFDVSGQLEVRIKSKISSSIDSTTSNVLSFTFTPYPQIELEATIYMVGSATEFGDEVSKATRMFRSATSNFVYNFTGKFKKGQLLILQKYGSIYPRWGSDGSGGLQYQEDISDPAPLSIPIIEDGYYTVTIDLDKLKFTVADYIPAVPAAYGDMKMNGDFNGWGAGIPMTNFVLNPHIWYLEYTFAGASSMKFQTGNWASQFGPTKDWSSLYGVLDGTVDNLYILTGSYIILFNDITKQYLYIKK